MHAMKIDPARIRALRAARAWSQEQLAEVAGLSVRTVQRAETGGTASVETRMALASALEVAPAALCEASASPPAAPCEVPASPPSGDTGAPPPGARTALERYGLLLVGLAIVFLLAFGVAYQVGRDLAHREARAKCEAEGRGDCR